MIHHTAKWRRDARLTMLLCLTLACLASCALFAGGAKAFTGAITDIEDPSVEAKVLSLEIEASRTLYAEHLSTFVIGPGPREFVDTAADWNQTLTGGTNDSLAEEQRPKVTRQQYSPEVILSGKVVSDQVQGYETYSYIDGCMSSLTTSKSPLLDVKLKGFYRSGTSASSGNPQVSVATENQDPYFQSCPYSPVSARVTRIQTFAAPTPTSTSIGRLGSTENMELKWTSVEGDLTTTNDACTPEYCDFTISGSNKNTASVTDWSGGGTATTAFKLRLRLEYPAEPSPGEPVAARAKITKHPRKVLTTKRGKVRVTFAFKSDGPAGTRFKCRLDKRPFAFCSSPFKRNVKPGNHRFAVAPVFKGKVTGAPTVYEWKVKRTHR